MNKSQKQQELKQHEVDEVFNFLKRYGKWVGIGALIVVITVVGSRRVAQHNALKRTEAEQMLSAATSPQQLEEILKKYESTDIAPVALLDLAKTIFNSGDYSQARTYYEQFLKEYRKHELLSIAELGLAYCTEADGHFDEATEQFKLFITHHEDSYLQPDAVLSVARCLKQAGRTNEARIVLEDFLTENTTAFWNRLAETELQRIE